MFFLYSNVLIIIRKGYKQNVDSGTKIVSHYVSLICRFNTNYLPNVYTLLAIYNLYCGV